MRHIIVVSASLGLALGALNACGSNGGTTASSGATGASGIGGGSGGSGSATGAAGGAGASTAGSTVPSGSASGAASGVGATGTATTGAMGSGGTTGAASSGGSAGSGASGAAMSGATGASGTSGASGASGASPDGGSSYFDGGSVGCAPGVPGAIFCDGFEEYPVLMNVFGCGGNICDFVPTGSPPTMPTWLAYHFHGPPYVDTSKPYGGKQQYHLNTETGHPAAADIIKESPDGVDLWPAAHYGRVMLFMKAVPPKGPFALMTESGLLPGGTMNESQYTLGSVNGKLAWIYTQRVRPFKNSVTTPTVRLGANWQTPAQMPTTMCTVGAATETIAAGAWECLEWMIDRTKPELHIWINGAAQTEVDVTGSGGTCSAGMAPTWTGPEHFTELDLGFEMWGNDANAGAWEAWYDDFAIGTQRLGCPMPGL